MLKKKVNIRLTGTDRFKKDNILTILLPQTLYYKIKIKVELADKSVSAYIRYQVCKKLSIVENELKDYLIVTKQEKNISYNKIIIEVLRSIYE